MKYTDSPKPRLFAHRGGSAEFPENTLEAFQSGASAGAEMLELDVHASRDGEIVVIHDPTLDRTTDGHGRVRDHSMAELEALDAGFQFADGAGGHPHRGKGIRIPRLRELLQALPGVPLNIEIKQVEPILERQVVDLLAEYDALESVLLAAAEDDIMQRIRTLVGDEVLTGFAASEATEFVMRVMADDFEGYRPPGFALQVPPEHSGIRVIYPESVEAAHRLGLEIHAWTINVPGEIETLIEMGVDGIMSDDVAMAASVVRRYRH